MLFRRRRYLSLAIGDDMHRVLNLGAGTQSSVLVLMADRGEIEPVDVAIFADTGWEPTPVYEHLEWLKRQVKNTRIEVVSNGNIYQDALRAQVGGSEAKAAVEFLNKFEDAEVKMRWASMPLHVKNATGKGMIRRQCTYEYKIRPIERFIKREVLGLNPNQRWPTEPCVTQIFGISADEYHRQRAPDRKCIVNSYPFVEMRWHRSKAIEWAERNYPDHEFPRSACIGCPFHSNAEWRDVKKHPEDWDSAVELDEKIRHADKMRGQVFLHASLLPLDEVDLESRDSKNGQLNLFQDECHGICAT